MSYQKHWVSSLTHKSRRMMTMCSGTSIGKYMSEVTVEPILFMYMLSTFSQYALFQDLVYSKVCWTKYSKDSDICHNLHDDEFKEQLEFVQRQSSHWILMSTISLVVPSLLIAMYLGSWSDRFGRKFKVVCIPPLGGVCACLVYIVISVVEMAPVGWICLASLLSGLTGGFVGCIMSCMTYVASITSEENRTVRISRLEAMIFVGGTIGPFASGTMLSVTGHAYAFFFMMLCYAFAFLYAILFVNDINKDGTALIENDTISHLNGHTNDANSSSGRSRNKSSDTIPSSVVATTLSTTLSTSSREDMEQKESLLSASDLHVAAVVTKPLASTTDYTIIPSSSSQVNNIAEFSSITPDIITNTKMHHPTLISAEIDHHHLEKQGKEIVIDANGISGIPHQINKEELITADSAHHHPTTHQEHNGGDDNIRNSSIGSSSSGRNSSMHGHDDGSSSAASDDDQRNMLRRRRHSSTLMDDDDIREGGAGGSSSSSCCSKYFSTSHLTSAVVTVAKKRENGKRTLLMLTLLSGFMFMVITAGEMDVAYLFARAEPLKWDYKTYSYFFGFKYGFGAFVLLVAMPFLHKLGVEDSTLAIVGILSRMAALVLYGLSVNQYMAFSVPAVAVFSVFTIPATRSLLSKLVGPDEQGKMFAFVAMMEDICTLSASLVFNSIYPLTRPIMQGLIFLLAAAVLIIPILIMSFVRWKILRIHKQQDISRRLPKAHLHAVDGADPAALLCIPKEVSVGK